MVLGGVFLVGRVSGAQVASVFPFMAGLVSVWFLSWETWENGATDRGKEMDDASIGHSLGNGDYPRVVW